MVVGQEIVVVAKNQAAVVAECKAASGGNEAVNDAAVIAVYKTAMGGSYDGRRGSCGIRSENDVLGCG